MSEAITKRVYCLKVKPLYVEAHYGMYYAHNLQPLFCHCLFHDDLVSQVLSLREQLIEQDLNQMSKCLPEARWFFELSHRVHHEVKSYIHVTAKSVFFTGYLPPFDEPQFQTSKIPITELSVDHGQFKHLDPVVHSGPLVNNLIVEIEAKEAELVRRIDQSYAIDKLADVMDELDEVTAVINTDLNRHQALLRKEVTSFTRAYALLEQQIEDLSLRLLYLCLQVQVGDWISSNVANRNKMIQLVVESVSYAEGWLFIRGTNVTQKGKVGKRNDSISIAVLHEH